MQGNPALLENHPDYDKTLVEAGNYICNQISAQKDMGINSYKFQYILVQHYSRFLEDVINIGKIVLPVLFKYSKNNWVYCNAIMNSLVSDKRTPETTKEEWSKLAKRMLQLFKICEK